MFKKQGPMAKTSNVEVNAHNLIAAGTKISGDVNCEGNIRVDGEISGNLICQGKVVVGESGKISGELICQNANVSGTIDAKIQVSQQLTLTAKAKINGEISTGKLSIEPGAVFTGTCEMGNTENIKVLQNGKKDFNKEEARAS
ncbi:MAG: polymer-forming cytoskeletal protein [Flavobacteriales bacterium]|nr:polymer-forming cytoskeletal protein [Flavobacteriales bacterium]